MNKFNNILNKDEHLDKKVFHYTSPKGLYSILENGTFRFTDCQFLNDKTEYIHINKVFSEALNELISEKVINNNFEMARDIIENDKEYNWDTLRMSAKSKKIMILPRRYYVFCTSVDNDSLNMWNHYVKNNHYQGYNIGCAVNQIKKCLNAISTHDMEIYSGRVKYKKENQVEVIKDIITEIDKRYSVAIKKLIDSKIHDNMEYSAIVQIHEGELIENIKKLRLFFKHKAFIGEKEFRFVITMPIQKTQRQNSTVEFGCVLKNGIFVPHCDIKINKESTIETITLSSMLEHEIAKKGLEQFLKLNEYRNVVLNQSEIPIRG